MRPAAEGRRAGGCDWNPTAPARHQTAIAGNPKDGGADQPSPSMVAATAEVEGFLRLLARIVRQLASMPAPEPQSAVPAQIDATAPAATGAVGTEGEVHRGSRCDPSS
jgi:hypothetical protein